MIGPYAIKIGKIRLVRFVSRLLVLPFSPRLRHAFIQKYGVTWRDALLNDLFAGFISNCNEYTYFQEYKDNRVMPTFKKVFYGHIVLQVRGKPTCDLDIKREYPHYQEDAFKKADLWTPKQFCVHPEGKIKIADYGERTTIHLLQTTHH